MEGGMRETSLKTFKEKLAERTRQGRISLNEVRKPLNEARGKVQQTSFPDMEVLMMALPYDQIIDEKLSRLADFTDAASKINGSDVMVLAMWVPRGG
jgi:hypothetical protein